MANPLIDAAARAVIVDDAQPTPLQSAASSVFEQQRSMLRESVMQAQTGTPEKAAQAIRLGRETGLPADLVERNYASIQKDYQLNQFDRVIRQSPKLSEWLTNPENAKIAYDDTENLGALENVFHTLGRYGGAFGEGVIGQAFGGTLSGISELLDVGARALDRPFRAAFGDASANALWYTPAAIDPLLLLQQSGRGLKSAGRAIGPVAGTATFGTDVAAGLGQLGGQIATSILGPAALTTGLFAQGADQMAEKVGGDSASQTSKDLAIVAGAGVTAATERFALDRILGPIATPIQNRLGATFARIGIAGATEGASESVENIAQDVLRKALTNPDAPIDFGDAAYAGGVGATVGAIARGMLEAALHVRVRGAVRDQQAQEAQQKALAIDNLNQLAAGSQLRSRDAQTFEQFVQHASQDGPVQDLFISAQTLAQSGVAEQVVAVSPSIQQQYATALQTGSDIRIPLAEYAANIAPEGYAQPLVEHLKIDPLGFSQAEAREYLSNRNAILEQEVNQALDAQESDAAFKASQQAVQETILGQLQGARRFTDDVNQQYATLTSTFYGVQAARLGVTPEELYQRFPLKIVAQQPMQRAVLEQEQRGSYDPSTNTIALLKSADLSTYLHESGHAMLEMQAAMATDQAAPAEIRADMGTLLSWFGVQGDSDMTALDRWSSMSLEEKRAAHEQFARGFEAYLFEGKSPSVEIQGIFQRFRAWLVNVYRQLRDLNVELTDEVRGVMDRMLATPDQIQNAEAAASMGMVFKTPEEAAQFGVDWRRYQDQGLQATQDAIDNLETRGVRDMKWLSNAKSRTLKGLQKEADSARREVEADVRREVMAEPVYQAWQFLTAKQGEQVVPGVTPEEQVAAPTASGKLRTQVLREMYGTAEDAVWRALSSRGMTSDARGNHPDIVAEQFGFDSGDAMVKALASAEDPETVVRAATDERMLRRFGDTYTADGLDRAANEAIHNEARARFIATEQAALAQATGGQKILADAARHFAAQTIARLKVREVSSRQYQAAEARAGREADRALRDGDLEAAALAKRNQLINNYAVREANGAREDVEKALRYFRRVGDSKTIDPDYRDQIQQLLERYALRPEAARTADRRTSLAQWIAQQQESGLDPEIPEAIQNDARRFSYQDMTVEELRGLRDTIKQIEHLGRLKNRLLTARDQRTFEQVRDELTTSILDNSRGRTADTRTAATPAGRAWAAVKNFGAAHIKAATWARIIDGDKDGGPLWEHVIRTANERAAQEATMRAEATRDLMKIMAPVLKQGRMNGKGAFFPSIGRSLNREQVFSVGLNMGNEGNIQRLLGGEGWSLEQVRPVLDTLTKTDWDAIQAIWSRIDQMRPEIQAKHRRVYGVSLQMVEPLPVLTKFGAYKGGYFPIIYDPRASIRAEQHEDGKAAQDAMKGAYNAATTRRTFTKARSDEVNGRPLLLSTDGIYRGINEVIHDLTWHEWLIDSNKLLGSEKVDRAMRETYGPEVTRQFKTWREDVATEAARMNTAVDSALGIVRQNVSVTGLGFNVVSALLQPFGMTQSVVRVGAGWITKGVGQYVAQPIAKTREVREKSEFMANRARTRFRELNELRNQVQGSITGRERFIQYAYVPMMKLQETVDIPTWLGAYEKAMAEGNAESRAIALADQAVIDSQGDGSLNNLAGVERGGPVAKLFTVFYAYMNTAVNLLTSMGMSDRSATRKAADFLMLTIIPTSLTALLKASVTPGGDDDDGNKILKTLAKENIEFFFGLFVLGRDIAAAGSAVAGVGDNFGYQGPAGLRPFADLITFGQQLNKSIEQGEVTPGLQRTSVNLGGAVTGLPSAQINRFLKGAEAISEGETSNPAALVFGFQR